MDLIYRFITIVYFHFNTKNPMIFKIIFLKIKYDFTVNNNENFAIKENFTPMSKSNLTPCQLSCIFYAIERSNKFQVFNRLRFKLDVTKQLELKVQIKGINTVSKSDTTNEHKRSNSNTLISVYNQSQLIISQNRKDKTFFSLMYK